MTRSVSETTQLTKLCGCGTASDAQYGGGEMQRPAKGSQQYQTSSPHSPSLPTHTPTHSTTTKPKRPKTATPNP